MKRSRCGRSYRRRSKRRKMSGPCRHPIPLNSELKIINILRLLHSQSNEFKKACIQPALFTVQDGEMYRGISATKTVPTDVNLLVLPDTLLIKPRDALQHLIDKRAASAEVLTSLPIVSLLALFLLLEIKLGKDAAFRKYIATLPDNFLENPSYLSESVTPSLPATLAKYLDNQNLQLRQQFQSIQTLECFQWFSFDDFKFAFLAVNTRTVFYESEKGDRGMALAPFLDLFNHSPLANTETFFDKETRCYIVKSSKPINRLDQVFVSYGHHSNHSLWLDYGFVPNQPNPFNLIPIEFNVLFEQNKWLQQIVDDKRKVNVVKQHNLNKNLALYQCEISYNLALLIQLSIWNPDSTNNFDFDIDFSNAQFKEMATALATNELVAYEHSFETLKKLPATSAIFTTINLLNNSITFIKSLIEYLK